MKYVIGAMLWLAFSSLAMASETVPQINVDQAWQSQRLGAALKVITPSQALEVLHSTQSEAHLSLREAGAAQADWYRLQIDSTFSDKPKHLYLVSNIHVLQHLDVFLLRQGKLIKNDALGLQDRQALSSSYHGVVFDFELRPNEQLELLIRKQTEGPAAMSFTLYDQASFDRHLRHTDLFWGLAIGVLLALAGYNALIYSQYPRTKYRWYLVFQLAAFLEYSALYGFGYLIFPESLVRWLAQHITMLNFILAWSAVMFSQSFLRTEQFAPQLFRCVNRLHVLFPVTALLGLVLTEQQMMLLFTPFLLATAAIVIASAVMACRNQFFPAKLYLLSWIPLLLGGGIAILAYANVIPQNMLTLHAFMLGTLAELYLLSIALAKDLGYQEALNQRLSRIDPVLKLPNRNFFFQEFLKQLTQEAEDDRGLRLILVCVEGSDFMQRVSGNSVLLKEQPDYYQTIGQSLLREPWLVPVELPGGSTYFGIAMSPYEVMILARAELALDLQVNCLFNGFRQSLSSKQHLNDLRLTAGVVHVAHRDTDLYELYRRAHFATIEAKKRKTHWFEFDPRLDQQAKENFALLQDLQAALTSQELQVYFQPQVDIQSGRVTSAEALMRWLHPTKGLISPATFIPLAEKNGLMFRLTQRALEQVFAWQAQHGQPLPVSVNLSVLDLKHESLVPFVEFLLTKYPISGENIVIEITESQELEHSPAILAVFNRLRQLGFKLSVDDFGTGYSSMRYLSQLQADEFKVDRSIVTNIDQSPVNQAILKSLLRMAESLGADIVVEGIETEAELAVLRKLGCHRAQGFYWSSAIPVDKFYQRYLPQSLPGAA